MSPSPVCCAVCAEASGVWCWKFIYDFNFAARYSKREAKSEGKVVPCLTFICTQGEGPINQSSAWWDFGPKVGGEGWNGTNCLINWAHFEQLIVVTICFTTSLTGLVSSLSSFCGKNTSDTNENDLNLLQVQWSGKSYQCDSEKQWHDNVIGASIMNAGYIAAAM